MNVILRYARNTGLLLWRLHREFLLQRTADMTKCFSCFLATTSNIVVKAKLKKISGVFFVASLMTGCATYHPKPISAPDKASAFEARTLYNPALKKFMETNLRVVRGRVSGAADKAVNLMW
jgi:hypothetical protein